MWDSLSQRLSQCTTLSGRPPRRGQRPAQVGCLLLLAVLALLGVSPGSAQVATPPAGSVLLLHDSGGPFSATGEAHALLLTNLLGHFGAEIEAIKVKPVTDYTAGDMHTHLATFYLGSTYEEPTYHTGAALANYHAFLADAATTTRPLIWMNYNLWLLANAWNPAWGAPTFAERFGFTFAGIQNGLYNRVLYKDTELLKSVIPFANPGAAVTGCVPEGPGRYACSTELNTVSITDPTKAQSHAEAYSTLPGGSPAPVPYIVRATNFWFVGDLPFPYLSEEDRYLAFADLLHDMLGIPHTESHVALVRLEDVSAGSTVADVDYVAAYLRQERVPFAVATVPLFQDPLGITNDEGMSVEIPLPGSAVGRTLEALQQERLASIVLHGYTHQWEGGLNPYNELTGDDFEFYRVTLNPDNSLTHVGPVPEDSAAWATGRIAAANVLLAQSGLRAFAWEAPHYLASATDYQAIRPLYPVHYGRLTYFTAQQGASVFSIGQFFPYLIHRDVYGYRVVPESLGNIEPEPLTGYRPLYPADLLRHAAKLRVVRDGIASFFYHPFLVPPVHHFYLAEVVQGLKTLGYQFVAAETLLPQTPTPGPGSLEVTCVKYVASTQKLEILGKDTPGGVITAYSGIGNSGPVLGTKAVKADGGFGIQPAPIANPGSVTVLSSGGDVQSFAVNNSCTLLPL